MIYDSNEEEIIPYSKDNWSRWGWLSRRQLPQENPPEGLDGDLAEGLQEDGPEEVEELEHGEMGLEQNQV